MDPDMKSLAYVERILMIWIFSTSDFHTFVVVDSVTHTDMHYFKYKAPKNKVLSSFPHRPRTSVRTQEHAHEQTL